MQSLLNNISDENILELLENKATYDKGFSFLMQKYQERLYWHIRRMVFDHEDANDVIQNTFIKVFKGLHNFKGDSKLYTWLYRIATNESITFLNKKKRRASDSIDDDLNFANQLQADSFFDGNEAELRLQCALKKLPKKQLLVFNLRYYDEMTYKEISKILETSIGALKASYHHAVKKIESYFQAQAKS